MIDRLTGIGASEISAVAGLNPWRDAMSVWLVKTGRVPDFEGNLATRIGTWNEPFIAQEYANATQRRLRKGVIRRHRTRAWVFATPDFYVMDEPIGLEIKFTSYLDSEDWGPAGTDLVPAEHLCQCQWGMEVADLPYWDLAVMAGTRLFRIYSLQRDQELINMLIDAGERFWVNHVLADVPPPMENPAAAELYLRYVHGKHTTEAFRKADQEAEARSDTLRMVCAQLESLEEKRKLAEVKIKFYIGDAAGIEGRDFQHSWKQSRDSKEINWEAVARELHASPALIAKHTTMKRGSRRFIPHWLDAQ